MDFSDKEREIILHGLQLVFFHWKGDGSPNAVLARNLCRQVSVKFGSKFDSGA